MELRVAMNDIWGVNRAGRGRLRVALVDRVFSFAMILLTGVALLASTVASTVLEALRHHIGAASPALDVALSRFAYPVGSFTIIVLLFALVFKILPACRIAWGDVWMGALFSAALFTLGKYLIGLYLSHTTVVSVYGAAGSLVVLLLWIYYSSQIFLLGAVLSSVYSERIGSRKHLHAPS
jgi:membrane protein